MKSLSQPQAIVYDFIRQRIQEDGIPPSVREICERTGIKSTSTVHYHLNALETAGYITRDHGRNRSIKLTQETSRLVPLLGRVTAGQPIMAVEEIEDYIPFPGSRKKGCDLFALRVQGESMIDAGILDGDIVVVEKVPSAQNGDIVVALVEGENATVKRFYKEDGHYRLQPENPTMEPIIVDQVEILGQVVACLRFYNK